MPSLSGNVSSASGSWVLAVCPDPATRRFLEHYFEPRGYRVECWEHARSVERLGEATAPEIIFTDAAPLNSTLVDTMISSAPLIVLAAQPCQVADFQSARTGA